MYPTMYPTVKRMMGVLNISREDAQRIRDTMEKKSVLSVFRLAEKILDGSGIEYIAATDDDQYSLNGLEYVNVGDPYTATVMYDHKTGRYKIGGWGDVIERDRSGRFETE